MQQSKAGKKLNPIIAARTAPIFERDPKRYQKICMWVWWAQKQGWPDEAIAQALKMADSGLDAADSWWKLLTYLLPKAKGRATEQESAMHKMEIRETTTQFLDFIKLRAEGKI